MSWWRRARTRPRSGRHSSASSLRTSSTAARRRLARGAGRAHEAPERGDDGDALAPPPSLREMLPAALRAGFSSTLSLEHADAEGGSMRKVPSQERRSSVKQRPFSPGPSWRSAAARSR